MVLLAATFMCWSKARSNRVQASFPACLPAGVQLCTAWLQGELGAFAPAFGSPSRAVGWMGSHLPLSSLQPQPPMHRGSLSFSHQDSGLDEPLLGAHKDQGSLPYFSGLTPGCSCFLSSSVMCSSSTGHTRALPGTGSGEEQRRHRAQPGTMAPGSASLLLSVCIDRARPMPSASSCPKLPKVERSPLLLCPVGWETKPHQAPKLKAPNSHLKAFKM